MTAPEVDPLFAHRVLAYRVAREWTVEVLAERSGLATKVVSAIECDVTRPVTADEAEALAAAFGETVAAMVGAR